MVQVIGQMFVQLLGDAAVIQKVVAFLEQQGVEVSQAGASGMRRFQSVQWLVTQLLLPLRRVLCRWISSSLPCKKLFTWCSLPCYLAVFGALSQAVILYSLVRKGFYPIAAI